MESSPGDLNHAESYATILETLAHQDRSKVQTLISGDHEFIYPSTTPQARENGIYDILKSFGNIKSFFTAHSEGFNLSHLTKGYQLIIREPPRQNAICHVIRDRDIGRHVDKKHCPCFKKMMEEWEEKGVGWDVRGDVMKSFIEKKREEGCGIEVPVMGHKVVLTAHVWRQLDEAAKPYRSVGFGPRGGVRLGGGR